MKLLVISAAFPPMRAGEAEHAVQLCRRLAEQGLEVHVLTTQRTGAPDHVPFTIRRVMRDWSWLDLPRLAISIRNSKPDAVMLIYSGWIYNAHPMITFAPTISKYFLPDTPFVTQMEIDQGAGCPGLAARGIRKLVQHGVGSSGVSYEFGTLLRDSDRLIVLSEQHLATFAELQQDVTHKCVVIPPPPLIRMSKGDHEETRQRGRAKLAMQSHDFLLAFFGYADRNKGIDTLFHAVQILSKQGCNIRLVMIGGGRGSSQIGSDERARSVATYEREMLGLPERLGISDKVMWLQGYDSDSEEASTYLHAADACVLPFDQGVALSRSSFAAAAAHALPIITTRGPRLERPFRHEENVLLCEPKDPEGLARAIRSLMEFPDLRRRLQDGARQLADEWFSWHKVIERTIQTFAR
ncbi:MAG: glycosyltransferase family 4 protein [Nitrospiraceae bacterium]